MKILLVEDSPIDVDLCRRALSQSLPELELAVATSVAAALTALGLSQDREPPGSPEAPGGLESSANYQVVLTGWRLPDGSGLDLVRRIRQRGLPCAVVVLTAEEEAQSAIRAIEAGADDYLRRQAGYHTRLPQIVAVARARLDRRLLAVEGIARDVTQTQAAAAALQEHLAELEALYKVASALRTAQTMTETVFVLLDQTLQVFQTDAGAVWLYDELTGRLEAVAASGWCRNSALTSLMAGIGITGTVFSTATPHLEEDVALSPHLLASVREFIPEGWSGGWAPIRTSDEVVGVLFIGRRQPNRITAEQIKFVISLAEMAGSILQRLRLLQDAQAQAELTRQIVNTVPEGLISLDDRGRVLLANGVARTLLADLAQWGEEATLTHLAGRELAGLLAWGPGAWQEIEFRSRSFIFNAQPVEAANPAAAWVLVLDEVTRDREQKRYQEAQDRLATVGQLAAGIAHDFNNVLGVISIYADLMQTAPNLDAQQQRQLGTIVDQAHHAASLVRQVLDFSRQSVMERMQLDLYPLVSEQIKLLDRTLPKNIELRLEASETHFAVTADPTRVRQVLMNLAINARDAMPAGGVLTFALDRLSLGAGGDAEENAAGDAVRPPLPDMAPGNWLRMSVSDTGTGIAPAQLVHIFEPFFTTKPLDQGAGLGLSQVYGIVKQHGGAIDVTSTLGEGTTFYIYLPFDAEEEQGSAPSSPPQRGGGSECILLVEDNIDLCRALAQSLESLGYQVLQAVDAATALRLACEPGRTIDLILSDMVMPERSGLELGAELQHHQPGAQLLIMTGHPVDQVHAAVLQAEPDLWIQKPFTGAELAGRVRAVLDAEARRLPRGSGTSGEG